MTENKKITLNIIATYGRSLYTLICGLLAGRWVLMALGIEDFGLYGVVGALVTFVMFLNTYLAAGIGRFYALCVGEEKNDYSKGLENCRMWFTTGVIINTFVPILLISIGLPIGEYFIRFYLTIPYEKIQTCVYVWYFSCMASFICMISSPFVAMFNAKQDIAERTMYEVIATTMNILIIYYMVTHPGKWLLKYSGWMCLTSSLPFILMMFRAYTKYEECRFDIKYSKCWARVKEMSTYSGWVMVGGLGEICRNQGFAILVNKKFGPNINAAISVGTKVSTSAMGLTSSMTGAFWPAIMNAWGAGDKNKAIKLSFRVCKIGCVFTMVFSIPLIVEINQVLDLWLDKVPTFASGICVCYLLGQIFDNISVGLMILINAKGKMKYYQLIMGGMTILTLPVAYCFYQNGYNVYAGTAIIATFTLICAFIRVIFARLLIGISVKEWLCKIFTPLFLIFFICYSLGNLCEFLMDSSIARLILSTSIIEIALLTGAWFFLLDRQEKEYITNKIKNVYH